MTDLLLPVLGLTVPVLVVVLLAVLFGRRLGGTCGGAGPDGACTRCGSSGPELEARRQERGSCG